MLDGEWCLRRLQLLRRPGDLCPALLYPDLPILGICQSFDPVVTLGGITYLQNLCWLYNNTLYLNLKPQ